VSAAVLPEELFQVYHERESGARRVPLARVYRDLTIAPGGARPAVAINMVQTLDGVVAVDGAAWSIGSEIDHYLFRTLRGWADAVLSGAGTLRRNDVIATTHRHLQEARAAAGRPANPLAVVVSRRAEFSDAVLAKRFFAQRDFASIVITTELARDVDRRRAEAAGAEVLVVPADADGDVELTAALDLLASRGVGRVLAEGGPHTNRRLVAAGLVDELFVTVVPRVAGSHEGVLMTGLLGGAGAKLQVISELQYRAPEPREWYFRFRIQP
jgi:riboflavin biosynthesis pyrimidine reductase